MKDGFIKVAAGSVKVTVADVAANTAEIKRRIRQADEKGVNLLVLPELCLTGYTCGDLFYSDKLLRSAREALLELAGFTSDKYPLVLVGLPLRHGHRLFNCAAVLLGGKIIAIVPKTHLPNYSEFYEKRQFASADALGGNTTINLGGLDVPFGRHIILRHESLENFAFGIEICEDLWTQSTPGEALCRAGATIIANLSASNEIVGKEGYRRLLVQATSARLICGYVCSNAGPGESTQDTVFSQHHLICENGILLAENRPFEENELIISEIDVERLAGERHRLNAYLSPADKNIVPVTFSQEIRETELTAKISRTPFVPAEEGVVNERAEKILAIQAQGLKKRLEHTRAKKAVLGISGGLDSCLALLVTARAMDMLSRPRTDIIAVTMPCFGTTKRTKSNAERLCACLGVTLREIDITESVTRHFKDIGHDESEHDLTFENSQARERTQVLMDIANKESGLVVGTGDLSELALGWATYNGDHMSMYAVNSSVPKTLVRHIVRYVASRSDGELAKVLFDILDTPVSPELLPAGENDEISQKTEDLVGPYELHDFFLYYALRFGFGPAKIYRLARYAFDGAYDNETILRWLKVFFRRFFSQQFKRSCMPDGPKVGSVSLSPRSDWRMPSDASSALWLSELENL